MPTDYDDDLDFKLDDDDDGETGDPVPPPQDETVTLRRDAAQQMRKAAKRSKSLEEENRQLKRQIAFDKAGVDISTKQGAFFAEHFDPSITDPDKIREAAEEHGVPVIGKPAEPEGPDLTPGEDQSTRERQELAAGAQPDDGTGAPRPDPKRESVKVGKELIDAGGSIEEGIAASLANQARAAIAGDERAVIKSAVE